MDQTTLQQRIEAKAAQKLLRDLLTATEKQAEIISMLGEENFPRVLNARTCYDYQNRSRIELHSVKTQEVFDSLLPKYISLVTDDILEKIGQIDYLVSEKLNQEEY